MPISLDFTLRPRSLTSLVSIFFLLRWPFLDIENVLLEPVARRQDGLPPFPATPGPPSKTIPKRDDRWWSASRGRMLELIALVRRAILEESAVEVIVQSFA
jgi:hypothetical protein